ncbi:MAG: sugar phosphate isomerase/epimerase [Planctomycetota bacterium]|nr:sugar phosphate isomerase/epimerase [Planctomycetota bacterium]
MADFKIGVMADSFRLPVRDAIRKAKEIGAEGVQIYAVRGEMDPDNLVGARRREFRKFVEDQGLEISALCGDLGGHGFERADDNRWKIPKSKKIMDLAVELGTKVVTTHIGVVPKDRSDPKYKAMKEACEELAGYGDRVGAAFAIETGPETAAELRAFLDGLNARGVRVNYDPANLVMVTGDDPVAGVEILKDYIVHTHAKDGIRKKAISPEVVYGHFAEGGRGNLRPSDYFLETPLGKGGVDFPKYLAALRRIGYKGFLTIEREVGANPAADIAEAVRFLRGLTSS